MRIWAPGGQQGRGGAGRGGAGEGPGRGRAGAGPERDGRCGVVQAELPAGLARGPFIDSWQVLGLFPLLS